ncbi:hypothetical protein A8F94_18005 [Bacillus sp. FJAT-27225]|uniref:DUF4179 domain-containing protein n=1 Tax=Bacillus sp. FJAT-27225 TaxID=1743144 RepID=UPI00080C2F7E|nr:DUF4179 domain-containing protein [Bacillus sp. FJAT-27225]OCA83039.1 hypothetical protein A8F94_18005 [Bacillus sp. FJAT-27225]
MRNLEEEKLANYKKYVDETAVPVNRLDAAILAGFEKAKREDGKRRSLRKKSWFTVAAAAVILIGFFTSIRLSPAFAGYVSDIPGIGKIVELIHQDKGLIAAFESEYDQEVGVTSKNGGVTFTIDRVIADESGLALFYSIETEEKQENLLIDKPKLVSTDGSKLLVGSIGSSSPANEDVGISYTGILDIQYQEPTKARSYKLDVEVGGTTHTLNFTLKEKIHGKKDYALNKTITVDGQEITIKNIEVYPLRAAIHVEMGDANSKKILNFDNMRLIDGYGEVWGKITNGTSMASFTDNPDKKIVYLQSNYFREPKELYLVIGNVQAVNKDEAEVVIDTSVPSIVKQPASKKFSEVKVEDGNLLIQIDHEKPFHYFPFSTIKDADGKEVKQDFSFSQNDNQYGFSIPQMGSYGNLLTLELNFYPEWIKSNKKIRIK